MGYESVPLGGVSESALRSSSTRGVPHLKGAGTRHPDSSVDPDRRLNHNNTISGGFEKSVVVKALLGLHDEGHSLDASQLQGWALARGWGGDNPANARFLRERDQRRQKAADDLGGSTETDLKSAHSTATAAMSYRPVRMSMLQGLRAARPVGRRATGYSRGPAKAANLRAMGRRVNAEERLAIFLAWDRRCVWCRVPLFFNDMEIEHLIAKNTPAEDLPDLLLLHNLPADYDVWATENLAASCRPCNLGKGRRPIPEAPAITMMLDRARENARQIREQASEFQTERGFASHLAALLKASQANPELLAKSRAVVAEVLSRSSVLQFVDAAEYRLASQYVTDASIRYGHPISGSITERRVWLVNPPGKQPVAVVLEGPDDDGWFIQNAAEEIAYAVARKFPSHATVLHYDQEPTAAWGQVWIPIPFINAEPRFGETLREHPEIAESLTTSGLLTPDSFLGKHD